jgi:hypothetical protein
MDNHDECYLKFSGGLVVKQRLARHMNEPDITR